MKVIKGVGRDGIELQEYRFGTKSFAHQVSLRCNDTVEYRGLQRNNFSSVGSVARICLEISLSQMLEATCTT